MIELRSTVDWNSLACSLVMQEGKMIGCFISYVMLDLDILPLTLINILESMKGFNLLKGSFYNNSLIILFAKIFVLVGLNNF